MLDVTDMTTKCYAMKFGQCTLLIRTMCDNCKFYKPIHCEDWIRIDQEDRVVIVPPEEYEEMNRKGHRRR